MGNRISTIVPQLYSITIGPHDIGRKVEITIEIVKVHVGKGKEKLTEHKI